MSKMINIFDLHREQDKKEEARLEIYTNILDKVHQKIKLTSKTSADKFCFFSVPTYVYGLPLFDVNNCIIFLTKKLTDNGFNIRYTHPNLLLISWLEKPKKQPSSNFNSYNSIENLKYIPPAIEYRPITEYKPTNNFVYDANSFNTLQEKANKILYNNF
jgi:hypothetical protein